MKRVIIVVAVLLGVVASSVILNGGNNESAKKSINNKLTFASVEKDVDNGGKLYDVRTADEFTESHIKLAANWSLQDMQNNKLPNVSKNTKIYVYCRSGNRSGQATAILKKAGYNNVTSLGGLSDVEAIGGDLI